MYVYQLTSPNGKSYIGVAKDVLVRFRTHARSRHAIGKAIRKYGAENFKIEILLIAEPEVCYQFEIDLISRLNTLSPNGYNLVGGGKGIRQHSAEVLARMSASISAAHSRPEARALFSTNASKQWSDPDVLKRSIERNKKTWSDPAKRAEHSTLMKNVFKSPDVRKKFSSAAKRQWSDPTIRSKMQAAIALRPRGPNGAFLKRVESRGN